MLLTMKECRAHRVGLWVFLAGFAGASITFGAQDPGMILGSPSVSNNAVTFTLNAESGVSYTILTSSNLVDWVAVATNADPGITRTITISNPPAGPSYYRAARDPLPLFGFALTAKGRITFSNGRVDSFDGANGPYSPATATSNAVVVTDSTNSPAINLTGNAYIHGNAVTGPGGTVAGSAAVSGTISHDANIQINDVAPPVFDTFSTTLSGGTVNGTNYTYIAGMGNYLVTHLSIASGQSMLVNGNAVIYCTSTANNCVNVGGSGFIYIAPGASLTLYVAGPSMISGDGVVNGNQRASDCYIYGLPSCTAMTLVGSANFTGVMDAPEANFTLSGGAIWSGAGIVNSIDFSAGASMHYDENLARVGPTR